MKPYPVEVPICSNIFFQQMSKAFPFYCIQNEGNMLNIDKVEARMDWKRRDVLTRNYLVSTIESQQQKSLVNCRTANEMWTRLSAQHLRNAVEIQHVLQQRLKQRKISISTWSWHHDSHHRSGYHGLSPKRCKSTRPRHTKNDKDFVHLTFKLPSIHHCLG